MAKELKAKGYKVIPGHSVCRQFVKKYDNIMEGDQMENESDVEQNESDNGAILVKCQGRSSIPALTLWVSSQSICVVLLNTGFNCKK